MATKVAVFKIKEGKLETWKNWCGELMHVRKEEALATLREEKVLEEMSLLIQVGEESYVIGFAEGEMLPADKSREINQKHTQLKKECLEYVSDGETLYRLL